MAEKIEGSAEPEGRGPVGRHFRFLWVFPAGGGSLEFRPPSLPGSLRARGRVESFGAAVLRRGAREFNIQYYYSQYSVRRRPSMHDATRPRS